MEVDEEDGDDDDKDDSDEGFINPFDVNYMKNNASMSVEKFEEMLKPKIEEMQK